MLAHFFAAAANGNARSMDLAAGAAALELILHSHVSLGL